MSDENPVRDALQAQQEKAASGSCAEQAFSDSFLHDWISARLGDSERRLIILLRIRLPATAFDEPATAVLEPSLREHIGEQLAAAGAQVVEFSRRELVGIWGVERLRLDDPKRAIACAARLQDQARAGNGPVLALDAINAGIPKCAGPVRSDALLDAIARCPPLGSATCPTSCRLQISAAFRRLCDVEDGIMPVSDTWTTDEEPDNPVPSPPSFEGAERAVRTPDRKFPCQQQAIYPRQPERRGLSSELAHLAALDALGDLKPLIMAAAIAGMRFEAPVLAQMLEIDAGRIQEALNAAERLGVIQSIAVRECMPGSEPHGFEFRRSAFGRVAYQTVPPTDRLRLHRRAAASLPQTSDCGSCCSFETIAEHHKAANNPRQTKRWLSKAAWQAIACNDAPLAISHLNQALETSPRAPSDMRDRMLLQLLAVQLALAKGNAANDVFEVCQRSLSLPAGRISRDWRTLAEFRALWGLQSYHLVAGEIRAALTIGNVLLNRIEKDQAGAHAILGMDLLVHRMHAVAVMLSGEPLAAAGHYTYVDENYSTDRHAVLRFAFGSDQAALALAHRSWINRLVGAAAEANRDHLSALHHADRLDHPHTTAHTKSVLALAALMDDDLERAMLIAGEARASAVEHNFPYWTAWCDVIRAAGAARLRPRVGLRMLDGALAAYTATGAGQLGPLIAALQSEAARREGKLQLAREHAVRGLRQAERNGIRLYVPELLRQRARVEFAEGDIAAGSGGLEMAHHEARRQATILFARRIAKDGIRHTRDQDQINWQARFHAVTNAAPAGVDGIDGGIWRTP